MPYAAVFFGGPLDGTELLLDAPLPELRFPTFKTSEPTKIIPEINAGPMNPSFLKDLLVYRRSDILWDGKQVDTIIYRLEENSDAAHL